MKKLILLIIMLSLCFGLWGADSTRTRSALETIFADQQIGAISAQDLRDFLASVFIQTDDDTLDILGEYLDSTGVNYLNSLFDTGVTNTEYDYLDGVTSSIQDQLDAVAGDSSWVKVTVDTLNAGIIEFAGYEDSCYIKTVTGEISFESRNYFSFGTSTLAAIGQVFYIENLITDSSEVVDLDIITNSSFLFAEVGLGSSAYGQLWVAGNAVTIVNYVGNISINKDAADSLSIYADYDAPFYYFKMQNNIADSQNLYWKIFKY